MDPESFQTVLRVARWLNIEIGSSQQRQLVRYHGWLESEAIPAGGVGPNEAPRLWQRHIADSLTFGIALPDAETVADIGSGAGLPGVPLAIVYPHLDFTLVDRSGRRCDLIRRAIAILRVENCNVVHSDVRTVDKRFDAVVSRAAIPLEDLMIHVKRLLIPQGCAVLGLSQTGNRPIRPGEWGPGFATDVVELPLDILDTPAMLLRIRAT